jgi:serine/threonine protein kinase
MIAASPCPNQRNPASPYEIVSPLGAGGMGEVYRARDPRLGRDVAIKVLPESLAADPTRLKRFEQEARAVAANPHPNILAIFDIGAGDVPFLVTELRVADETPPLTIQSTTGAELDELRDDPEIDRLLDELYDGARPDRAGRAG